eukprot:jgi/Mesen1/3339/ME000191S02477
MAALAATRVFTVASCPAALSSCSQVKSTSSMVAAFPRTSNVSTRRSLVVRAAETKDKSGPIAKIAEGLGIPESNDRTTPTGNKADVFEGGRAQEILNSRAAMVGFVAALIAEVATGESVFTQLGRGGIFTLSFAATIIFVFIASFAPRVKDQKEDGLDMEAEPVGPFNQFAEVINGRSAMIGFVALLVTEAIKGSSLLPKLF